MFIFWSSGGDVINYGGLDTRYCSNCGGMRTFNLVLMYRYWALYWLFGVVTKKEYMLLCSSCLNGWNLNRKPVDQMFKACSFNDKIPFMRKYGLLILFLLPFLYIFLCSL